jgi:hypothetical protein
MLVKMKKSETKLHLKIYLLIQVRLLMKQICQYCQKEYDHRDKRRKFCSHSCAAKTNNRLHPKRERTIKCRGCSNLVLSGYTFCENCVKDCKHLKYGMKIEDRTLGEEMKLKGFKGANRFSAIRNAARSVTSHLPRCCTVCKYGKHVEVCHKKAIADFHIDAQIKDINSLNNLVLLCPNCHWEFDSGLFSL